MRLARLICHGFKSFADRTTIEFDEGVTCIVGPNGCGKSNVVDAIKWTLGEQSAKHLRGKAMMDVIFNGTSARKPMGMSEVQLVFDNTSRKLPINTDEVQIGRRLFRTGESEYLINGSVARLRDVREVFFDTGVGRTGYSIIEQGRVSQFVDSTPKDRRAMFEEAAGISKFKVRIAEATRKLESVTANVDRADDVLEELERRLRAVKAQATKARTYQELTRQLNALRSLHARAEYRRLDREQQTTAKRLEEARAVRDEVEESSEHLQAEVDALAHEQRTASDAYQQAEQLRGRLANRVEQLHQQIAAGLRRLDELASAQQRAGARAHDQRSRRAQLEREVAELQDLAANMQTRVDDANAKAAEARETVTVSSNAIAEHRRELDRARSQQFDATRTMTQRQSEIANLDSQSQQLTTQREKLAARQAELEQQLAAEEAAHAELAEKSESLDAKRGETSAALSDKQRAIDTLTRDRQALLDEISELRQRRSGIASRQSVLEGLEKKREGVGTGPRAVLEGTDDAPPFEGVVGLVADLFTSSAEHAPLVESALGRLAQAVVVESRRVLDANADRLAKLPGRVTFICLDELANIAPPPRHAEESSKPQALSRIYEAAAQDALREATLAGPYGWDAAFAFRDPAIHAGVHGYASDFVTCDDRLEPLRYALLGRTIVCDSLAIAEPLRSDWPPTARWVTLAGEVLEGSTVLTLRNLGLEAQAGQDAGGIISRHAELTSLAEQLAAVDAELTARDASAVELDETFNALNAERDGLRTSLRDLDAERSQTASQQSRVAEAVRRLKMEAPVVASELSDLDARAEGNTQKRAEAKAALSEAQQIHEQAEAAIADRQQQLEAAEASHREHVAAEQAAREAVAVLASQRQNLQGNLSTAQRQLADAERTLADAEAERDGAAKQHAQTTRSVLAAEQDLASTTAEWDAAEADAAALQSTLTRSRSAWESRSAELKRQQDGNQRAQREFHAADKAANNAQIRLDNLLTRVRDELGMDLIAEAHATDPAYAGVLRAVYERAVRAELGEADELGLDLAPRDLNGEIEWAQVEEQIKELRGRVDRLGSVNVDAIREQGELEERLEFLQNQRNDLDRAAKQLTDLIERLNEESRTRFIETFELVRENFQRMFRKLFGGGKADIILEKNPDGTDADVLEAGIDVLARPPGMETKTLTLLSGGQKAMIAVAILMSIFEARPSPFCILDEVDAPLDEANNARFNAIVKEFLEHTQFLVITHSKTTMAIGDRLYGITMQEPGVSKRVGVKFDKSGQAELLADDKSTSAA